MAVIDTNDNASARIDSLRARGVTAVGRYYSIEGLEEAHEA